MGLADALQGGLRGPVPTAERPADPAPAKHIAEPIQSRPLAKDGGGKCSHPDFARVGVYVRKRTRKAAERKWEDAGGGDLSDLVELLLSDYATKGLRD